LRKSRLALAGHITGIGDSGYQGLYRLFYRSQTPHKKPPKAELTIEQRPQNRRLSQVRLKVEHLFCRLKVFKILSYKYRNHRKRFALRFNLIAALVNRDLPASFVEKEQPTGLRPREAKPKPNLPKHL
jgi:transposase